MTIDQELFSLAERLYPLPRTVMGMAVLETMQRISNWLPWVGGKPMLKRHDTPVGTKVFDWTVLPDVENRRAYHPSLEEVPAYKGPLTYCEGLIPGQSSQEVLLSTYTCHPRMANDNVSGMVVTAALAKWLASAPRRYSYRLLFAPETIGALCWLRYELASYFEGDALAQLRERIIAGYTINNCGDERAWSFVPSRKGNTLTDRAARHAMDHTIPSTVDFLGGGLFTTKRVAGWKEYTFADRGSDERQFCAPGVDLPIASVMRSKHGTYPEYHTADDKLGTVVTAKGLGDSFRCYQRIIETIEANRCYRVTTIGEPRLDQHGLYPTSGGPDETARIARDLCACSDGSTDLIAIAEATGRAVWEMAPVAERLQQAGLLSAC